jgi:1-phosphatidylinositol-4-phosphate 5-kinase
VLKDLDWIGAGRKLHLGPDKKRRLLAQIKKDCAFLESLEVIDYSLLVGIHRAASTRQTSREREASRFYKLTKGKRGKDAAGAASDDDPAGGADVEVGSSGSGSCTGSGSGVCEASASSAPQPAAAAAGGTTDRGAVQIVGAVSQQQLQREYQGKGASSSTARHEPGTEPDEPEVGKEIYFIGCIDILCEYGLKKQLEHHYKAAKHGEKVGAQNFSVVDPVQYSTRFQNFVAEALD